MMEVVISVIVCAYNEERFIGACLRSLLAQKTAFPYEVVIVNDSSTDNTVKVVEPFLREPNFSLISNDKRLGIGASSNQGIISSAGRYVVRVDADDFVSEFFLQGLMTALIEVGDRDIRAVRCDYRLVDESGGFLEVKNADATPIACGIMWERDAMVESGLYNDESWIGEDVDFETRFLKKFDIFRLSLPLYRYRVHEGNTVGPLL